MTTKPSDHTILIADDYEDTLTFLDMIVRHAGYKTILAHDGKDALEKIRAHKPSLALLDLMMPELHGVAVCQKLKADPATKHIKVVIISVKTYPADHEQASEAGADLFMAKPVQERAFIRTLDILLGLPERKEE